MYLLFLHRVTTVDFSSIHFKCVLFIFWSCLEFTNNDLMRTESMKMSILHHVIVSVELIKHHLTFTVQMYLDFVPISHTTIW